jgi:short-subunit dehydrogenase
VVLVTGASSGIGRALVLRLAERGDHLVLLARAARPLAEVAQACRDRGAASVEVAPGDVLDQERLDRVVETTLAEHGRLDAVAHSAGVVAYGRFDQVPAAVWNRVLETNVVGAANVARAVLPSMRARDAGTLVLLGSVIGQIAVPNMSSYAVSKWALHALARELQLDNRDRAGVQVSVVALGSVDTPIYAQAANYLGFEGRPPPPVYAADTAASRVVDVIDRPRKRVNVGAANPLMRLGFTLTPGLFDALVGPLFGVVASGRDPIPDRDGNVLEPVADAERVGGGHGLGVVPIARDVGAAVVDAARRLLGGRAAGPG